MRFQNWVKSSVVAIAFAVGSAHGALLTDPSGFGPANVVTFDEYLGLVTSGPENVGASIGSNVNMTATTPSTLGAFIADLGTNGTWAAFVPPGSPFAAIGAAGGSTMGTMTFSFVDPVSAAGALLNTFSATSGTGEILISALGLGGITLESHLLNVSTLITSFNEGGFFGIQRPGADITGFAVTGDGFVLDNLSFAVAAVPEPATWSFLIAGLGLLGFVSRLRRR